MEDLKYFAKETIKAVSARLAEFTNPDQSRVSDLAEVKASLKNFEDDYKTCWQQHVESMTALTGVVDKAVQLCNSLNVPDVFDMGTWARNMVKALQGERVTLNKISCVNCPSVLLSWYLAKMKRTVPI